MTNIDKVRDYILKQFQTQMDVPYRNIGIEHTLHVVSYGLMLSKKRNIDEESIVIAAYFHDISTYISHYSQNHAARSSKLASETLPQLTTLDQEKIHQIVIAIQNHSTKEVIHDPLSETLKDADVLAHYYAGEIIDKDEQKRLSQLIG